MKLEILKTRNKPNSYKIISTSNQKHPALIEIAKLLRENNKTSKIKIGVYSIHSAEFCKFKTVYSYIAERSQKMCRSYFYRFLKGAAQMKPDTRKWKSVKLEKFDSEPEYLNVK